MLSSTVAKMKMDISDVTSKLEWIKKNSINNYIAFFSHMQEGILPKEETFERILK